MLGPTSENARPFGVCLEKNIARSGREMAIATVWPRNQVLRVKFLGGDPGLRKKVMRHALQWNDYSNVQFRFIDAGDAEIRVDFDRERGSWSALGTEALDRTQYPGATIHLNWEQPQPTEEEYAATTLHEFGHALGCIHEHQSPAGEIPWDVDAVYAYYEKCGWDRETTKYNVLEKWNFSQGQYMMRYSEFDDKSIMLYPIPAWLTKGRYEVGWNHELSPLDKQFIAEIYPKHGVR